MIVVDANGNQKVAGAFDSGWTPTRVIFADAAGRPTEDAEFSYDSANNRVIVESFALGYLGTAGFFGVAHTNNLNNTDYALIQNSVGATVINAKSGQVV